MRVSTDSSGGQKAMAFLCVGAMWVLKCGKEEEEEEEEEEDIPSK